jgi:hypothetical protein
MRLASLLLASLVLSGCRALIPETASTGTPTDRALPRPMPQGGQRADPARESSRKRVTQKEDPATLIAADRTQCFVALDEYRVIKVGDSVSCAWSPLAGRP